MMIDGYVADIICKNISNGREFEVPTDYFRSLYVLRNECNSYTQSEARYTELLAEHDKQIRADAIEECEKSVLSAWRKCIKEYPLSDRTPFTNIVNEIMDSFEQLKGSDMSNFKCPMCTDCPDSCPLDTEEDTREYSADYYKGKADGAREFAEWLCQKSDIAYVNYVDFATAVLDSKSIDEVLAEWQKGDDEK